MILVLFIGISFEGSNPLADNAGGALAATHGLDPVNPASLVNRQICKCFYEYENFFIGTVVSFTLPEADDTPDLAGTVLFHVVYADGDESDYTLQQLEPLLIPLRPSNKHISHSAWVRAKRLYAFLSSKLPGAGTPTANANLLIQDPHFLMGLFNRRSLTTVNWKNVQQSYKTSARELHPDKVNHPNVPEHMRYVCAKVLSALRYLVELYQNVNRGGAPPTVDPPLAGDFIPYGSPEFMTRFSVEARNLSQDPFIPPPTAPPPPAHGATPQTGEDRYGKGIVVEPSAFDDPAFNVLGIPNDITALDCFNIEDTFINPFTGVLRIPQATWQDWAASFSKVSRNLLDACNLPADEPMRGKHILQAAKWYSALPQLILRQPGRNLEADTKIIKLRLHQFLTGNYSDLIQHWVKDVRKQRTRRRRLQGETSLQRVKRAIDLILRGDIARGLRLTDSHGIAPEDAAVHAQMKEKHPVPEGPTVWPVLPADWIRAAAEVDVTELLRRVTREADVRTGVGPRRVNVHYIQVLALGVFDEGEAQDAFDNFTALGTKYLSMGMPAWLRACLGGGLLTALNKSAPVPDQTPDARPVKAEDSDTSLWCKSLARFTELSVRNEVVPQQLGVGVSGGLDLYVHGGNMKAERATSTGEKLVMIAVDIKNAHNSFDRVLTQTTLIEKAQLNSRLIPLAVAHESIACAANPIYMRSNEASNGFVHLCDSLMGGGQGNALTGQLFVINLDSTLKETEAAFPGVELKAIQDDITIYAKPENAWDALAFLRANLENDLV